MLWGRRENKSVMIEWWVWADSMSQKGSFCSNVLWSLFFVQGSSLCIFLCLHCFHLRPSGCALICASHWIISDRSLSQCNVAERSQLFQGKRLSQRGLWVVSATKPAKLRWEATRRWTNRLYNVVSFLKSFQKPFHDGKKKINGW